MIQHQVVEYLLLPDEREPLEKELKRLADQRQVHVIFTTGGTGKRLHADMVSRILKIPVIVVWE